MQSPVSQPSGRVVFDPEGFSRVNQQTYAALRNLGMFFGLVFGAAYVPGWWVRRCTKKLYTRLHGAILDVYPAFSDNRMSMLQAQHKSRPFTQLMLLDGKHKEMQYMLREEPSFYYSGLPFESRQGTLASLPFDPKSFDCVICQYGLCQTSEGHADIMAEMLRVCKPDGRLLLIDWGVFSYALPNKVLAMTKSEFQSVMSFTHDPRDLVEKAGGMVEEHQRYFLGGLHFLVARPGKG